MATRMCPECGQSIKLENMRKHYANVHPGKDSSKAISEAEHRQIRKSVRKRGPAFYTRRPFQVGVAVALIVVLAYAGIALYHPSYNIVADCGGEGTAAHYHPLLVINYNGVRKSPPAEIGISNTPGLTNPSYYCPSGLHMLHTHDTTGIIHVEIPFVPPPVPTLVNFFTIWGEPLSSGEVWQYSGRVHADMYNMDARTSSDYSSSPASIPLYVPRAGLVSNPYTIPPSLGSGTFSGEIIWLNVTYP